MKTWKIAVFTLALLFAGCGGAPATSNNQSQDTPQASGCDTESTTEVANETNADASSRLPTVIINTSCGEKVKVWVEVADNPMGRGLGLRGRESLPEDQGMLFVYTEEAPRSYTMADTLIPLSIAFIDSERRIIDIQDMKPLDDEPPGYDSAKPAQYALEVNKGFFEKNGVKVGDRAELPV